MVSKCLNAASTVSSTVSVLLVLSTLLSSGSAQSDQDIFNFALQLEYLEAEFYNYAAGNGGLPASDRGGGPVPIGGRAASLSSGALALAQEIALNEKRHVEFLRSQLGPAAVACPQVNLTAFASAFSTAVAPATVIPPFSPFANDIAFWLATFLVEDVGVSAYQGAVPLLSSKSNVAAAAGIFASEAYQAGLARTIIFDSVNNPYQIANGNSQALSLVSGDLAALRAKLGGGSNQNVINSDGSPEVAPVDNTSRTIPRTTAQIIAITTGGSPNNKGLFFPNGLNGSIK